MSRRHTVLAFVLVAVGLTAVLMLGAGKGSCIPVEPEVPACTTHDDCGEGQYCREGACETLGACDLASDCEGQPLVTILCVGWFSCVAHECVYQCSAGPGQGEPCGPGDACGVTPGLECLHYFGIAGPQGPEFTTCEIPCDPNVDCGPNTDCNPCPAGQACVTIADGPGSVCRPVLAGRCDPAAWRACGDEQVCVARQIEGPGECGPFDHGQSVGAGYVCGGSIGVSCAEGLHCAGLPQGAVGGTGTCTRMTCADWAREYEAMVANLGRCDAASECVDIPGTSCGCTRNLVLNASADLTAFWALVERMSADGCGLASTCDCPPANGFACRDGHCVWNYVR